MRRRKRGMEHKDYNDMLNELRTIRKLLVANLYSNNVSSEDLDKITGMGATNIRKLVSKRKANKNAKKESEN
jgi:hypothetical protein